MLKMETVEIKRSYRTEMELDFVDITEDLREVVNTSGIKSGRVTLFSPSTGCSLLANERESGLLRDIRRAVAKLEAEGGSRNALHIGASSIVIPLVEGDLRLGTWQRILLVELEQPAERDVVVQVVGE
jgi:secondary thiamine-phosphate synthase enzyme